MSGYKMKIGSEAESREAQELFFEMGYAWLSGDTNPINSGSPYIYTSEDMELWCGDYHATYNETNKKKITIPQLKGLVVLKRNNVLDANYTCDRNKKYYVSSDDVYMYVIQGEWSLCKNLPLEKAVEVWGLKPISNEETVMKEYLDKDYVLRTVKQTSGDNRVPSDWIEVPEGADIAFSYLYSGAIGFTTKDWMSESNKGKLINREVRIGEWYEDRVVWTRHTQPEELSFVDDAHKRKRISVTVPLDPINHPSHYASGAVECIDAIEASMTKEAFCGYLKGNVQKYIWRYENKGGVESLQKAQWYLNRLILLQSA